MKQGSFHSWIMATRLNHLSGRVSTSCQVPVWKASNLLSVVVLQQVAGYRVAQERERTPIQQIVVAAVRTGCC